MRVLQVKVIPQAARTSVEPEGDNAFTVYVSASALKGKANKEMCKALANYLRVNVSQLIVSQGDRTNEKTVVVTGE